MRASPAWNIISTCRINPAYKHGNIPCWLSAFIQYHTWTYPTEENRKFPRHFCISITMMISFLTCWKLGGNDKINFVLVRLPYETKLILDISGERERTCISLLQFKIGIQGTIGISTSVFDLLGEIISKLGISQAGRMGKCVTHCPSWICREEENVRFLTRIFNHTRPSPNKDIAIEFYCSGKRSTYPTGQDRTLNLQSMRNTSNYLGSFTTRPERENKSTRKHYGAITFG